MKKVTIVQGNATHENTNRQQMQARPGQQLRSAPAGPSEKFPREIRELKHDPKMQSQVIDATPTIKVILKQGHVIGFCALGKDGWRFSPVVIAGKRASKKGWGTMEAAIPPWVKELNHEVVTPQEFAMRIEENRTF